MPSDFLSIDTSFPVLSGEKSVDERFSLVENYLFLLLENLRYTLFNLGPDNFGAELDSLGRIITEPLSLRLQNQSGDMARMEITAQGLALRVSNVQDEVTQLEVTAVGLLARVSNAEGDITALQVTAQGLGVTVTNIKGDVTSLQVTAAGLLTRVSSAEGNISTVTQTANVIKMRLDSFNGTYSSIEQTVAGISTSVGNAVSKTEFNQTTTGFQLVVQNLSGIAAMQLNRDGLSVYNGGMRIFKQVGSVLQLMFYVDNNGDIYANNMHLNGSITTGGTISGAQLESDSPSVSRTRILGGLIESYNYSAFTTMTLTSAELQFSYLFSGMIGRLSYDGTTYFWLRSEGVASLKIQSAQGLSIDARSNGGIFIATSQYTYQMVNIGNWGETTVNINGTINLNGTVRINGVLQ